MKAEDTLREMLKELDKGIVSTIRSIGEKYVADSKILIGHDRGAINNALNRLDRCIESANSLHQLYCELTGTTISIDSFTDLQLLFSRKPGEFEFNLKSAHLKANKISIPNFPNFKIEKLVEAYEFSSEVLEAVKKSVDKSADVFEAQGTFTSKWFLPTNCFDGKQFVVTKDIENDIEKAHAIYMPLPQVDKVLMMHMLCESINELIEEPYSVRSLPELDHRIYNYFVISRDPHEKRVELDLVKIVEKTGLVPESQLVIGKRRFSKPTSTN